MLAPLFLSLPRVVSAGDDVERNEHDKDCNSAEHCGPQFAVEKIERHQDLQRHRPHHIQGGQRLLQGLQLGEKLASTGACVGYA